MKKKTIIISVALIGFILAVAGNTWADRERGGQRRPDRGSRHQKWDRPAQHINNWNRGRGNHFKGQPYRPVHRFKPRFHRHHHYRAPHRLRPKYRRWRHRNFYRHGYPRHFYWRHHRHYASIRRYEPPEDQYHVAATITDSGFAFSVGASGAN